MFKLIQNLSCLLTQLRVSCFEAWMASTVITYGLQVLHCILARQRSQSQNELPKLHYAFIKIRLQAVHLNHS